MCVNVEAAESKALGAKGGAGAVQGSLTVEAHRKWSASAWCRSAARTRASTTQARRTACSAASTRRMACGAPTLAPAGGSSCMQKCSTLLCRRWIGACACDNVAGCLACRNVVHKPCTQPGCETLAVFNHPTASTGLYCGQHKPPGFINVKVCCLQRPLGTFQGLHAAKVNRSHAHTSLSQMISRHWHRLSGVIVC